MNQWLQSYKLTDEEYVWWNVCLFIPHHNQHLCANDLYVTNQIAKIMEQLQIPPMDNHQKMHLMNSSGNGTSCLSICNQHNIIDRSVEHVETWFLK